MTDDKDEVKLSKCPHCRTYFEDNNIAHKHAVANKHWGDYTLPVKEKLEYKIKQARKDEREQFKLALLSDEAVEAAIRFATGDNEPVYPFEKDDMKERLKAAIKQAEETCSRKARDAANPSDCAEVKQ